MSVVAGTMTRGARNVIAGDRDVTVGAGLAQALLEFAVSKGADLTALTERSGVAPDSLRDQDDRIPLTTYLALMQAGQALCGDPALALHFGETVQLPQLSIVGLICAAAETVGEAHRQMNRYGRLMMDEGGGRFSEHLAIVRDLDGVWLEATGRAFVDHPCLIESAFARCVGGARAMFQSMPSYADRPVVHAVHFVHQAPAYLAEYERVFRTPLVFGADRNAIQIDEAFLAARMPPSNRYLFGVLSDRAQALLESLEESTTTRGRVEGRLLPLLHTGEASMERIAGELGLSRQTLFRKLKAEGVTYEQTLDELRHQLAVHYLSGRRVSVSETAYLVGFSEPAAFSRAFKRWTGSSPRHIRASTAPGDRRGARRSPDG